MITITQANRNITAYAGANNYKKAIKEHGYTFHYVDTYVNKQILFFAIKDKQTVIDFKNKVFYKCEKFNIISLGFSIETELYDKLISNFNGEKEFKNVSQKERIINIVNLVID